MRTHSATRDNARYSTRLAIVPLATMAAYPGLMATLDVGGVTGAVGAGALLVGWCALWATSAGPRPGDPDVHDRQVDVILALPLLAAAVWLALGFARASATTVLSNRGVISLALFLTAASLLLLGTRLAARLRWALVVPLLAMPLFTGRPVLLLGIFVTAVLLALVRLARRGRNRRVDTSWSADWLRAQRQPLPRVRTSLAVVGVVGAVLAVTAVVTPAPARLGPSLAPAADALDAAQHPVPLPARRPSDTAQTARR